MKHGLLTAVLFLLSWCFSLPTYAYLPQGVIGGDMSLKATGNPDEYILSVNLFIDRSKSTAASPDPFFACHIYRTSDNSLIETHNIFYDNTPQTLYEDNNPCASQVKLLIVKWRFTRTITLPKIKFNDPNGYYVIFQRCCRDTNPVNIQNPGQTGMTFRLDFKFPNAANSTPEFVMPEPRYACINKPFTMNFAAKDADGDQLEYQMVAPIAGYTSPEKNVDYTGFPAPASYPSVQWVAGSSAINPIPGVQPLQINSSTGQITVTPSKVGLYVFAVMVTEKRGGIVISQSRREYQIPVVDCAKNVTDKPVITANGTSTTALERCNTDPVTIVASGSATGFNYQWQRNGQDISGATSSTLAVTDEGTYTVKKTFPYGCGDEQDSDPFRVLPPVPPKAQILADRNQLLFDGDEIVLRSSPQPDTYKYQWSFGGGVAGGTSSTLLAGQEGTYKLRVSTSDGRCPSEDEIDIIRDIKLFVPSAFTPNNDEKNKTWEVFNLKSVEGAEVFVFNRNGGLVYYSDKDGSPWDGTYQNQKVPAGVYRYLIKVPGRRPQEGALHVIY